MYLGTLAAQPGILRPRVRGLCASHAVRDPSHGPSRSAHPHIGDRRRLPPPRPETLRSAGRCPCPHHACCVRSSDRDVSLKSKSDNVVTAQKPRHQTQSPAYACETLSLGHTCVRPHALALAPCRPSHCEAAGSAGVPTWLPLSPHSCPLVTGLSCHSVCNPAFQHRSPFPTA